MNRTTEERRSGWCTRAELSGCSFRNTKAAPQWNYIGLGVHKREISHHGLCGAEESSVTTVQRTSISKQRNRHLQTTLIEEANVASRCSPTLALLYDKEQQKVNLTPLGSGGSMLLGNRLVSGEPTFQENFAETFS